MFRDAIEDSGVAKPAREDALRRLESHFADQDVDRIAARDHLERTLRRQAPHLWPQTSVPLPPPRPATTTGADKPRRPQPVELSPAQIEEAKKLPPNQRLTFYREIQAAQQQR
jgi:hypothetical protein